MVWGDAVSFSATPERPVPHGNAYPRFRRVKDAFRFIRDCARRGPDSLERTKSSHVGKTYGVEAELIKRMKAKFRNELSFGEGK